MGKSGVLEHKSGKREKIDEKLLWRAYRNSPTLFRKVHVPPPTRYGLLFPKIGGFATPKLQSRLSQDRVKLRTSNLAGTFSGSGPPEQKRIQNIGEKGAWAYLGTAQIC